VKIYAEKFLDTFCLSFTFCGPPKKEHIAILRKLYMYQKLSFLKCLRNVTKRTKPLQVDNLITYKFVAILQASRRVLITECVKISVLPNVKLLKTS
jgi:hypothetical protein